MYGAPNVKNLKKTTSTVGAPPLSTLSHNHRQSDFAWRPRCAGHEVSHYGIRSKSAASRKHGTWTHGNPKMLVAVLVLFYCVVAFTDTYCS